MTKFYDCVALTISCLAAIVMIIVIFGIPILAIALCVFMFAYAIVMALKATGVITLVVLLL